jgi:zinc/manganese transport system permease protein
VSTSELAPVIALGAVCVLAVAVLFRPLLLSSIAPDIAAARGLRPQRLEIAFLVVIACATTMTVPVVGALLIFTLMIGPSAAAQCFTNRVGRALIGSVVIALLTIWMALACAYESNWPVGFYVSVFSAAWYGIGRGYAASYRRRRTRSTAAAVPSVAGAH